MGLALRLLVLVAAVESIYDERLDPRVFEFMSRRSMAMNQQRFREFNKTEFRTLLAKTGLLSDAFGINVSAPDICSIDPSILYSLIEEASADWISPSMFYLDLASYARLCQFYSGEKSSWTSARTLRVQSYVNERRLNFKHRPAFLGGKTVHEALRSLLRDGYLLIESWGDLVDMEAITNETMTMLAGKAVNLPGAQRQRHGYLSAMDTLMNDESLAHIMREYSGGPMRYEGTSVVHLLPTASGEDYTPVEWHHDRCGRRLKVFVFINDVTPESHPTEIGVGSNNFWWYWFQEPGRFTRHPSDHYMKCKFDIAALTGKRGGGFIFDSNSLHRAKPTGTAERLIAFAEFHVHGKLPMLAGRRLPCPNPALTMGGHSRGGMPGFPLYPNEGGVAAGPPRYT